MKTVFSVAITGSINSGKSTLARRLAEALGAVVLSSDEIRRRLPASSRQSGSRVFAAMRAELEAAMAAGRRAVLDSTGMSPRFCALLEEQRSRLWHVHLRLERLEVFDEREQRRADRPDGPVPRAAFLHSCRVAFSGPPDVTISTDDITPREVYQIVSELLLGAKGTP